MNVAPVQLRVLNEVRRRYNETGNAIGPAEIAECFNVSRVSVFEAMKVLVRKGELKAIPIGRERKYHRYAPTSHDDVTIREAATLLRQCGHTGVAARLEAMDLAWWRREQRARAHARAG